jgi:hypothetical protein
VTLSVWGPKTEATRKGSAALNFLSVPPFLCGQMTSAEIIGTGNTDLRIGRHGFIARVTLARLKGREFSRQPFLTRATLSKTDNRPRLT